MPSRASPSNSLIKKNAGGILLTDENNSNHDNLVDGNDVEDNIPDCGVAQRDERPGYDCYTTTPIKYGGIISPTCGGGGSGGTTITSGAGDFGSGDRSVRSVLYVRGDPRARNDAVHAKDLRPPESRACAAHPCY